MKEDRVIMFLESLMSESSRRYSETEKTMKIKTWMLALNDITDEQGMIGFEKAIKMSNDFMISAGKFRELCTTGSGSQSLEDEAQIAWSKIMSALNPYSCPIFKDSSIPEAIRKMGGWKQLCEMLTTDEPFRKKEFVNLYSIMRRKNEKFDPMLGGIFPDEKHFIGYDKSDDLDKVLLEIENKKSTARKLLDIINKK